MRQPFLIDPTVLMDAWTTMSTAKAMSDLFEQQCKITKKYVHACSRGHEAIQIALGLHLKDSDILYPYYRDDALLLSLGLSPYELMLQLFAKQDDPFSGGRSYYSHPSVRRPGFPVIPHQSSATGMQAIPATGAALGLRYRQVSGLDEDKEPETLQRIVVCSMGDAAMTEGEVSEALQMAALKQLPILYVIQDNEWSISATANETRVSDANKVAEGFGIESMVVEGSDFVVCYQALQKVINKIRQQRKPFLINAKVALLTHHTSALRNQRFRVVSKSETEKDPIPLLYQRLLKEGISKTKLDSIQRAQQVRVEQDFNRALGAADPKEEGVEAHIFVETPVKQSSGQRWVENGPYHYMIESGVAALRQLMQQHPECILYGQDVGERLGGVFMETASLGRDFGAERVFNTPIQEAFIVGSSAGMSAVNCKPIVEIQFADYMWLGLNQLVNEISLSCYLSKGTWPVSTVIRIPTGANGGGPYHSSSIESVLTQIPGIKIAYPSNGADLYGLIKAAFYDPNPTLILEHKGLYWSKLARTPIPDNYLLPFGQARTVIQADTPKAHGLLVVSYGMGVYWATEAAKQFQGQIEVIDLRTLNPLDYETLYRLTRHFGRCLIVTEEPQSAGFAQSLAANIQDHCFSSLLAPIRVIGSKDVPAIPLNEKLAQCVLPNAKKVEKAINDLLIYK